MSNLSELLPTGGGQNAVDFVASGTLSSGQAVILNSDGTVGSVVSPQETGTPEVFNSTSSFYLASVYDPDAQKVVIAYRDNANNDYGTAVVGTVSGTSISFGTPVVIATTNIVSFSLAYDSNAQKIVIAYRDYGNSQYGTSIVGTVSGTSISFGSPVVFQSTYAPFAQAAYDSNTQKVVIAYRENVSDNGQAVVGTVSGTSISFGSAAVFSSGTNPNSIAIAYDSNAQKIVVAFTNPQNSDYGTAIVGTVSGTSITFGTSVVFQSSLTVNTSVVYDSNAQKTVIIYRDNVSDNGYGIVGTVSGTSISFGSAGVFSSGNNPNEMSAAYDANAQKVVAVYADPDNSGYGTIAVGTVSGTSISFETPITFNTTNTYFTSTIYDPNNKKLVISYTDLNNSQYGTSVVFQNEAANLADFIGITASAIADTATGTVNIYGGINEAQTGLTIGADYYVQDDGSLSTTASTVKVGKAISATTINMMDLT